MTTSGPAPHHALSHCAIGPLPRAKLQEVAGALSPAADYAAAVGITVKIVEVSGAGLVGGQVGTTTWLEGISSSITLRDLIQTRVREEAAKQRHLGWEQEADRAIDAFGRNGFFVLVDDRQVTELDEELELTADSDIRFVRLVQLAGG